MIVRMDEGATLPHSELELPREPLDAVSIAGPKPSTWVMVGHRPVSHCSSGISILPLAEQAYPSWLQDELVDLKTVGA